LKLKAQSVLNLYFSKTKENRILGGEMMKIRKMSVWYKLSIVAAALVGGVVTRYAALVIMAGGHF
jgi:hypothetical protein